MDLNILKIFGLSAFSFFLGITITPILTHYLYKYKAWKKYAGKRALSGEEAVVVNELHKNKEIGTPRMGGVLIWASTLIIALIFWTLFKIFPTSLTEKLNFLSRSQTWLPLFALISASIIGLVDDILQIRGKGKYIGGGLSLTKRIALVSAIGFMGGWWFFAKLEISSILIPFVGHLDIGWFFIPFFIVVMLAIFSGGVIDGLDGLSGGIMASIFAAYTGIAFFQNQIDLATFCAVLTGAILAFLWFNIPPARFYMGETGMLGLTSVLAVVAFFTDSVLVLPIIAFPLVATTMSDILQLVSKKIRGKKIFLAAPIHHHFEAKGWPPYKVTMRFWVIGIVFAIIGMVVTLIGK
ncbi:phospho-N-acetylmuramoyl-pentapeptide-transferase [Patescibacteria group bacterium]|nr:phospho-N-acetylmuramoyl-pentapeptide-transferase [Patescibacteria group bacterium]MBU2632955.1 phospho-N-acetylmuramoyl-pentapeptide-transferase [Patescibacteria group bacterium]